MNPEEIDFLKQAMEHRTYDKQEIIFMAGQVAKEIYFVAEGCVRLYYSVNGNDKTAFFYTEGQFMCAGESYTYQVPARENFQAMEQTSLYRFNLSSIEKLLSFSPKFEIIARVAVENELIACQQMIASFVTKSAEERYADLLQTNGELFQRVPQHYIASYLGVSPETLSRIKKRYHTKLHS